MKLLSISKVYFVLCGLLFTVVSAKILTIETYGEIVLLIGLSYSFDFIFSGKFQINILKSLKKDDSLIQSVFNGAFIVFLIILFFSVVLSLTYKKNYYVFPLISFFSALQAILQMTINKNYSLRFLANSNFIVGTFTLFVGSALVYFLEEEGYLIAVLFGIILSVLYYKIKIGLDIRTILASKPLFFWNNKLSNIISSFSLTSFGEILPIFIKLYFDSFLLGIYQLSVKFIKTGLFFASNILANYIIKKNFSVSNKLFQFQLYALYLYVVFMTIYFFIYKTELFYDITHFILGDNSAPFIKYSIYFLSIFFLDAIIVALSSFYIRVNVNYLSFMRLIQLSPLLVFILFRDYNFSINLITIIISIFFIFTMLVFSLHINKNTSKKV